MTDTNQPRRFKRQWRDAAAQYARACWHTPEYRYWSMEGMSRAELALADLDKALADRDKAQDLDKALADRDKAQDLDNAAQRGPRNLGASNPVRLANQIGLTSIEKALQTVLETGAAAIKTYSRSQNPGRIVQYRLGKADTQGSRATQEGT